MRPPQWIQQWPTRRPVRVFDAVSSAEVSASEIVEILGEDFQDRGDLAFEQIALVRLRDDRWAALWCRGFGREANTPPVELVTVAASWQRLWRFVLDDRDRKQLAPIIGDALGRGDPVAAAPEEARFLTVLRNDPDDAETRLVYADYLEQTGDGARAAVARIPNASPYRPTSPAVFRHPVVMRVDVPMPREQAPWRAVVADAAIVRCGPTEVFERAARAPSMHPLKILRDQLSCTARWRTATPTEDVFMRTCPRSGGGCGQPIHFCTSIQDAIAAGSTRASIVLDPAVSPPDTLDAYDRAPVPAPQIVVTRNAITYEGVPVQPRPSLWSRIRDRFR